MSTPALYTTDPIAVKPYVKTYIEIHGLPTMERTLLRALLLKKTTRRDTVHPPKGAVICVELSKDEFYRYGCTLTATDQNIFSASMERRIKMLFEAELLANVRRSHAEGRGFNMTDMYLKLRDDIGLDEDCLPAETIKKHLDRFRQKHGISIKTFGQPVPNVTRIYGAL